MKRLFLFFAASVVVCAFYNVYNSKNQKEIVSELTLSNIEALSDTEKTETKICYFELQNGTNSKWLLFCNEKTDETGIYPCPQTESNGYYNDFAKDKCKL